jgi:hypothetical protein
MHVFKRYNLNVMYVIDINIVLRIHVYRCYSTLGTYAALYQRRTTQRLHQAGSLHQKNLLYETTYSEIHLSGTELKSMLLA